MQLLTLIQRSLSPTKFESQASGSPTKLSVPNRKQRNQPSNRVHDIEFATEISTSLLQQVRNLQSMLNEKEDTIKAITVEKARLEAESEGFHQRLRSLDESEHRYKDENWNLETQIHEFLAAAKEASDREKKLTHNLNVLQLEKTTAQKELDEIKLSHAKLTEDHTAASKHHDLELGSLRRNATTADSERTALQRRIDDLTGQNSELAKAVAHQRGRLDDRDQVRGSTEDDFDTAPDNNTPEHSPPPSPTKGTPRHSMLETETLKSSLHHAHRMIQNLKGNIHREKTEKLELKRMLQDARDELETRRSELGSGNGKRAKKTDSREFKKPFRPLHLGGVRTSRSEVFMEDQNWEEDDGERTPIRNTSLQMPGAFSDAHLTSGAESSDNFETANEASDAFETANERGTETEDFQTGAEDLSSDDLTETEDGPASVVDLKRPSMYQPGNRLSFQSTASLSGDDYSYADIKTPTSQPRLKLKAVRGLNRHSRSISEDPSFQDSPASIVHSSNNGTPQPAGQSLFAELGNMSDEYESQQGTPSRANFDSVTATPSSRPSTAKGTPAPLSIVPAVPKLPMIDSGIQTDAWEPEPATPKTVLPLLAGAAAGAGLIEGSHLLDRRDASPSTGAQRQSTGIVTPDGANRHLSIGEFESCRPVSLTYSDSSSQYDPELIDEKLAKFPSPPTSRTHTPGASLGSLQAMSAAPLVISKIVSEEVESKASPARIISPTPLSYSGIVTENVEPVNVPKPLRDAFIISGIHTADIEPRAEPENTPPQPAPLSFSTFTSENIEPKAEREVVLQRPPLGMSMISSEHVEPKSAPEFITRPQATFTISTIATEHVEPKSEPVVAPHPPASLSLSHIASENVEPRELLALKPVYPELTISSILSTHSQPLEVPVEKNVSVIPIPIPTPLPIVKETTKPAPLSFSLLQHVDIEPITSPPPREARRDGVMLPRPDSDERETEDNQSFKFPAIIPLIGGKKIQLPPIIAEDEQSQPIHDLATAESSAAQVPFRELSGNGNERAIRKQGSEVNDGSSQTTLTSDQIDNLYRNRTVAPTLTRQDSKSSVVFAPREGSVNSVIRHRQSQESVGSVKRARSAMAEPDFGNDTVVIHRPSSAASGRTNSMSSNHPPLPTDHKQVIAAAAQRSGSSTGGTGLMGPPPRPSSAANKHTNPSFRPYTPSSQGPMSPALSVKNAQASRPTGTLARIQSPNGTGRSRASSVSSFASEIETRFNMRQGMPVPVGMEPGTDPRMINAITQTMIGEYLWKYTRKAGRGAMSDNRHRRYFWVHPYTRTLYWSDRDPSTAGRAELKAKSVPIEAVRVVTDDNPMPPGLHRKSLVIVTPGRTVKFTATTGQRHETWFNALSYLLLRTEETAMNDTSDVANGALTAEDVAEFNPGYGNNAGRGRTSLSSYNSRTTRNASPGGQTSRLGSYQQPTLHNSTASRPGMSGTFSRLSSYWKPGAAGSTSSRRSRHSVGGNDTFYEASEVHDSAEDLREMIEKQDRESDRLENVRACCDGKFVNIT